MQDIEQIQDSEENPTQRLLKDIENSHLTQSNFKTWNSKIIAINTSYNDKYNNIKDKLNELKTEIIETEKTSPNSPTMISLNYHKLILREKKLLEEAFDTKYMQHRILAVYLNKLVKLIGVMSVLDNEKEVLSRMTEYHKVMLDSMELRALTMTERQKETTCLIVDKMMSGFEILVSTMNSTIKEVSNNQEKRFKEIENNIAPIIGKEEKYNFKSKIDNVFTEEKSKEEKISETPVTNTTTPNKEEGIGDFEKDFKDFK